MDLPNDRRAEWENLESTLFLNVPRARKCGTGGGYTLVPAYMRPSVAPEGKGELPRTEVAGGRVGEPVIGYKMEQDA